MSEKGPRGKTFREYLEWAAQNPQAAAELAAQAEAKEGVKVGDMCTFDSGNGDVWIDGTKSPYGGTPSVKLYGKVTAQCTSTNKGNDTGSFKALADFQILTANNVLGNRGSGTVFKASLSSAKK